MKLSTKLFSCLLAILLFAQVFLTTGCTHSKDKNKTDTGTKTDPVVTPTDPEEEEDPINPILLDYDFETVEHPESYYIKSANNLPEGVSLSDPAIYREVTDQWREYILGSPDGYDPVIPGVAEKVQEYSDNCYAAWHLLKTTYDGDKRSTAFNLKITKGVEDDEEKIKTFYLYVLDMVMGYKVPGTEYYGKATLLSDIKTALDYGYTYYYGQNVIKKETWGNWWYWDIGIPLVLTEILIALEDDLSAEDMKKYWSPFDFRQPLPSQTACNKIWIGYCVLASSFLQHDGERIIKSKAAMLDVFDYVTSGDGFYEDGSFIQHNYIAYSGGYGRSLLDTLSDLMLVLRGSRFDFREEKVKNQYRWAIEAFRPLVYGANMSASVRGREVSRDTSEVSALTSFINGLARMSIYAPEEYRSALKSFVRTCMKAAGTNFSDYAPLMLVPYLVGLDLDKNVPIEDEYSVCKIYAEMDRIAWQTPDYGACIAVNSNRTGKYEALNDENKTGWYQGDGMIYIYTDGYDYNYSYFHYVDPYMMPGTTVSTVTRQEVNLDTKAPVFGSSAFAGGVSCGNYGIAAFRLGYNTSKGYVVNLDISANKSYFMFDNEIICLGTGINDTSAGSTLTVVENRKIRTGDTFSVNGEDVTLSETVTRVNAEYMHFDNMGGYYFPNANTSVCYDKDGTTEHEFLEIYLDHGANPQNAKYAYVYLPEATEEQTAAYADSPDVIILQQTNTTHVVQETTLGITGYVFFAAGTSSDGVTASIPCCMTVGEKDGETTVCISDPSQYYNNYTVSIPTNATTVVSADEGVSVTFANGIMTVKCSAGVGNGETLSVTVK